MKTKKILYTCGKEASYPRSRILIKLLGDHYQVRKVVSHRRSYFSRYAEVISRLVFKPARDIDLSFIGFYGHPLVLLPVIPRQKPLIFDVFLSTYEVLCFERKKFTPNSIPGKLALWLDRTSCSKADLVLLHTKTDFAYFQDVIGVPAGKLRCLYIGADESVFYPHKDVVPVKGRVLFYGSFIPNQGVDTIIRAAALLKDRSDISFRLIGKGMDLEKTRNYTRAENLVNVEFLKPTSLEGIAGEVASADIILTGEFGNHDKARRVISSKTFQCMAMGKPFIAGDNPANRELLHDHQDALLSAMDDPHDLARHITELIGDRELMLSLGKKALANYQKNVSNARLGDQLKSFVEELL